MIAKEFQELENYLNDKKSWSQKSTLEKASFISIFVFIAITIVLVFWIGMNIQNKLKERETLRQNGIEITESRENHNLSSDELN